eukprot:747247-Hanusia_phi.AAC.1
MTVLSAPARKRSDRTFKSLLSRPYEDRPAGVTVLGFDGTERRSFSDGGQCFTPGSTGTVRRPGVNLKGCQPSEA